MNTYSSDCEITIDFEIMINSEITVIMRVREIQVSGMREVREE